MASSKLIGTAPDQVPTNADLGELAFQNKDSVEFTGGKGGLSSLDLTAIAASKNVSATDIFVYDTSKDSDGGAWRNRCQHTSWYNETLNTDIRGSRKEFPSVAVIVATSSNFTIYDGDDPSLPMWMVMNGGVPTVLYTTLTSLSAINGILCVGTNPNASNYYDGGVKVISFINDFMRSYSYGYSVMRYAYNIAQRNTSWSGQTNPHQYGNSSGVLLNPNVNDVAMTVLPNAPIDAATGLPIPTIAVATNGGVSVIHNTGAIANWYYASSAYAYAGKVEFYDNDTLLVANTANSNGAWYNHIIKVAIPYTNIVASSAQAFSSYYYNANGVDKYLPALLTVPDYGKITRNAIGGTLGLTFTKPEFSDWATGMVAYATTKYNTGWMSGNIKGAWLSDTTQETVVGAELVTNGDFSSSSGWFLTSGSDANATISGGQLTLYRSSTGTDPAAINSGYVIAGNTYAVTFTVVSATVLGNNVGVRLGDTSGITYLSPSIQSVGQKTLYIRANSNGSIALFHGGSGPSTIVVDNFSVRIVDQDRSVNNNGLQVYGSMTKTPVATGADLVAYSGFSSSNYLQQPYNSNLNFGTGDFFVSAWVKDPRSGGSQTIAYWGVDAESGGRWLWNSSSSGIAFWCESGSWANVAYGANIQNGGWCHVCATRIGTRTVVYVNGVAGSPGTAASNISNSSAVLRVGWRTTTSGEPGFDLNVALLRISATVPSPEQILKMYNDEKVLFQDNAKATLYGTSDAVTALAYDQDTKLLHVGTSSGRSVFQGLRRVDNTTTAVSTSISAANGLVAEN